MNNEGRVLFHMEPNSTVSSVDGEFTVRGYTLPDLIAFGKYLLSEQRENSLKLTSEIYPEALPYELRFREVHDADVANFLDTLLAE